MNTRSISAVIKGIVRKQTLPRLLSNYGFASLVTFMLATSVGPASALEQPRYVAVNFPACQAPVAGTGPGPDREGWSQWSRSPSGGSGPSCNGPPNWAPPQWTGIFLADINADGLDDLCGQWGPVDHIVTINGIAQTAYLAYAHGCVTNQGNGRFGGAFLQARAFNEPTGLHRGRLWIHAVDFNGDGRLDLCGRTPAGIVCQLTTPTGFSSTIAVVQASFSDANGWGSPEYSRTIGFARMSGILHVCGRGRDGILCFPKTGAVFGSQAHQQTSFSDANGWYAQKHFETIVFVDVNGDGHTDVCGRGAAGIYCSLWRPSPTPSFGPANLWTTQFSDTEWGSFRYGTIRFGDINRDGKADVCGINVGGLHCGLSNGTSFVGATSGSQQTEMYVHDVYGAVDPTRIADFDGDGKNDVCYTELHDGFVESFRCARSKSTSTSVSFESLVTRSRPRQLFPYGIRLEQGKLFWSSPLAGYFPIGFCWCWYLPSVVECTNQWTPIYIP
jgi:hypothetical protein